MSAAKQTRKASLIETLLNTAIGYSIAVAAQAIVFPWFGIHAPLSTNLMIGAVFTVVSIARGFVLRRLFEALRVHGILALLVLAILAAAPQVCMSKPRCHMPHVCMSKPQCHMDEHGWVCD